MRKELHRVGRSFGCGVLGEIQKLVARGRPPCLLRILRGAGASGLPTLEIASRMIEKSPGITRLVDRLEARRLVRRVRCPHDRRQVLCRATAEAGRLLAGLDAPMVAAAERALAPLDATDTLKMIELLDAIRAERNRRASQGEEH
jgi:DNA-binding MarR family transcriptional regulator